MNPKMNQTALNDLQDAVTVKPKKVVELKDPSDEIESLRPYHRQYGKSPAPTWFEVGALSFVCMAVGLVLGLCI